MIAYQSIGDNGRIGNQLFQIASTIGIAIENNHDFAFNNSEIFNYLPKLKKHIFDQFSIINNTYFESDFCYQDIKVSSNENIFLNGYFQSYKYFENQKNIILDFLEINNPVFDVSKKNINFHDSCSLHIRRGDYVKISNNNPLNPHPLQTIYYYLEAIDKINVSNYFVFSDDIKWCKENFNDKRLIFIDYPSKNTSNFAFDLCELQLMSLCEHNIIANSSYSWWAAYFNKNKNKKIIAPKRWFSQEYTKIISKYDNILDSLIPNDWILI